MFHSITQAAAVSCGRWVVHSSDQGKRERQDLRWKLLVQDHRRWWDKRQRRRILSPPDFRRNESGDPLWLDNHHMPACMDAQMANLYVPTHHSALAASPWTLNSADQLVGPGSEKPLTPESVKKLCQQGQVKAAVEVLEGLFRMNFTIDRHLFYYVLKECVVRRDLVLGSHVYALAVDLGFGSDTFFCNHFIRMYAGHGKLREAMDVFRKVALPDAFMWFSVISAHVKQGQAQRAIELYHDMRATRTKPNAHVLVAAIQASAAARDLQSGKLVHMDVLSHGLEHNMFVCNCLVDMYAKCASLKDARKVFDGLCVKDVVTWTAMIAGYAKVEGMGQEALCLYNVMQNEGISPNAMTFSSLLLACASVGVSALGKGKQLHSQLKDQRLESDVVLGGSLVNMYVKCGSLKDARIVFDSLSKKDMVTWSAMIAGYAQQESMGQEALNMYYSMHNEGKAIPDAVTFSSLLEACATVGALQQGQQLHLQIYRAGFQSDVFIGTCLVKMYAKCGRLKVSREVFDGLPMKNLWTWNALLKGYAEHGEGGNAIQCFEELLAQGIQPDKVSYTCLFTACSHAGLVEKGQQYFKTMVEQHGIEPDDQHYSCMVDLLGRSGHLDKAEALLRTSYVAGDAVSWTALLSACKSHGYAELGRRCFDRLVKLEPTDSTAYLLLSSIYANAGIWDEVERIESLRKAVGAKKKPGKACIEVMKVVHEFTVGQERPDVAATLRKLNTRVKEGGHVPQTQLVLRALPEQEKEDALCGHAEKLALAYGLLNTSDGSTLVITKNLRMCNDCHSSTKIMSLLEKREIVVRDGHKVHCFQNGACSCQDRP